MISIQCVPLRSKRSLAWQRNEAAGEYSTVADNGCCAWGVFGSGKGFVEMQE